MVDEVLYTIQKNSHTGNTGDCKILVINVEDVIKIKTNEHGQSAIEICLYTPSLFEQLVQISTVAVGSSIAVLSKIRYLSIMKNIDRYIFLTLLVSCYVFIISADRYCIPDGHLRSGKAHHLTTSIKQTHPCRSRLLLIQGRTVSTSTRINVLALVDVLNIQLCHKQFSQLIQFSFSEFYPTRSYYILYLPRGPTAA